MTRKEIFAKWGIEFDGDSHILYKGKWITLLLKEGNTKTGKRVYTWSMLPGTGAVETVINGILEKVFGTCVCDCNGCYAKTGRYVTHSVIDSLARNTYIVETDIDFFYRAISAQLETIGSGEIRIHAAGDFATTNRQEYADTWYRIVKENPAFHFWTYTKVSEYETLFDSLPNGNIVKSVIDGIGVNYGHCDYIMKAYRKLKANGANVYICRCGIDKNQHCENCGHCSNADFVLFLEHSTSYNAKKDPLYPEFVKLVESQAA